MKFRYSLTLYLLVFAYLSTPKYITLEEDIEYLWTLSDLKLTPKIN